jgi:hypothetical protein
MVLHETWGDSGRPGDAPDTGPPGPVGSEFEDRRVSDARARVEVGIWLVGSGLGLVTHRLLQYDRMEYDTVVLAARPALEPIGKWDSDTL